MLTLVGEILRIRNDRCYYYKVIVVIVVVVAAAAVAAVVCTIVPGLIAKRFSSLEDLVRRKNNEQTDTRADRQMTGGDYKLTL